MRKALRSLRDASGRAAIDGPFEPTVVIIGLGLPGMNGYEIARQLKSSLHSRNARLIALTGYRRARDREACAAAGFDHHMVKPAHSAELLAQVAIGSRADGPPFFSDPESGAVA